MIAQIDILSEIASFMPFADNLVSLNTEATNLPLSTLHNMNIRTTDMQLDAECVTASPSLLTADFNMSLYPFVKRLQFPDAVAKFILTQDESVPNFHAIIAALNDNPRLDRALHEKIELVYKCYYDQESLGNEDILEDEIAMHRLCRYDAVMKYYFSIRYHIIDAIADYFYGRTRKEMLALAREDPFEIVNISKTCRTFEEITEYVTDVVNIGSGYVVEYIISNTSLGSRYQTSLRSIYTRSFM